MFLGKRRGKGMAMNGAFWATYAPDVWIPEVNMLCETVMERAIPSVVGIEAEMIRVCLTVGTCGVSSE